MRVRIPITGVCTLLVGNLAAQTMAPVSQSRTVRADAFNYNCPPPWTATQSASAPDFNLFSETVSVAVGPGSAAASQTSELLSTLVTATGFARNSASSFDNGGSAWSVFSFDFRLDQAAPFSLAGKLFTDNFFGAGAAQSTVSLSGVFSDSCTGFQERPYLASGILAPGVYTLAISSQSSSPPGIGGTTASYELNFSLTPEPSNFAGLALLIGISHRRRRH